MTGAPPSAIGTPRVSRTEQLSEDTEAQGWATAKTLAESLPYIQIYDREVVVINDTIPT